jgi:hypothetical protein
VVKRERICANVSGLQTRAVPNCSGGTPPQVRTGGFKKVALFFVKAIEVAGVGVGCEESTRIGRVVVVHAGSTPLE